MNQPGASLPPPTLPRCYRHPDRETGRSCTRCGNPACPDCLQTASIGSHCLDCVKAARPDLATRARFWNARQPTLVTYALIVVNVLVYLWTLSDRNQHEFDLSLIGPLVGDGEWYRIVSSGFLHFSVFHILMNMFLLFQLGQMLEPTVGRVRFGLVYLASLLGGSALVLMMSPNTPTGGASGAVFGLMGFAAVGMYRRGISVMQSGIGATLLINLLLTFTISGISIGGHLGGLAAGALCGAVLLAPRHLAPPVWATYVVPIAVSFAAVVVSYIAVS